MEHALGCAVTILRCLLGPTSVDDAKVAFGMSLSILGCTLESDLDGFRCMPTPDKAGSLCLGFGILNVCGFARRPENG